MKNGNYSYWKSPTNGFYKMPREWMPSYSGWARIEESVYNEFLKNADKS